MSPSTPSVRNFTRKRSRPASERRANTVRAVNKVSHAAAKKAKFLALRILGKVGLDWGRHELTALTGDRLLAYMEAAKLTKPHGYIPGQEVTYRHLHPTKGFLFAPA